MKILHVLLLLSVVALAVILLLAILTPEPENPIPEPAVTKVPAREAPPSPPQPQAQTPEKKRVLGPLREQDEDGSIWMVGLAFAPGYRPGDQEAKRPGAPVIVKTDVRPSSPNTFSIGLILAGQAGETYSPVVLRDHRPQPAPGLMIVDEAGQVLVNGSFRYG